MNLGQNIFSQYVAVIAVFRIAYGHFLNQPQDPVEVISYDLKKIWSIPWIDWAPILSE